MCSMKMLQKYNFFNHCVYCLDRFLKNKVYQGNVVTCLRCGEIFNKSSPCCKFTAKSEIENWLTFGKVSARVECLVVFDSWGML